MFSWDHSKQELTKKSSKANIHDDGDGCDSQFTPNLTLQCDSSLLLHILKRLCSSFG